MSHTLRIWNWFICLIWIKTIYRMAGHNWTWLCQGFTKHCTERPRRWTGKFVGPLPELILNYLLRQQSLLAVIHCPLSDMLPGSKLLSFLQFSEILKNLEVVKDHPHLRPPSLAKGYFCRTAHFQNHEILFIILRKFPSIISFFYFLLFCEIFKNFEFR